MTPLDPDRMTDREAIFTGMLLATLIGASNPRSDWLALDGAKPVVTALGDYRPQILVLFNGKTLRVTVTELIDHLADEP